MLVVSGTSIMLTRGNTAELLIAPVDEESYHYMLSDGEKVIFTVKNAKGVVVIQKVLKADNQDQETGEIAVIISPEDTINLAETEYKYDVLLVTKTGDAYTFIGPSTFSVGSAIGTYKDVNGGNS